MLCCLHFSLFSVRRLFRVFLIFLVCCFVVLLYFFFFKQKTAYAMRISDWSSYVCSSDLLLILPALPAIASPAFLALSGFSPFMAASGLPPQLILTSGPSRVTPAGPMVIELPPTLRLIMTPASSTRFTPALTWTLVPASRQVSVPDATCRFMPVAMAAFMPILRCESCLTSTKLCLSTTMCCSPPTWSLRLPPTVSCLLAPIVALAFFCTRVCRSFCACMKISSLPALSSKRSSLKPPPPLDELLLNVDFVSSPGG